MPIVVAGGVGFDVDAVAFDKDGTLIDLDATWGPLAAAWVRGVAGEDEPLARIVAAHLGLDLAGPRLVPDSTFSAGTLAQIRTETVSVLARHGHGTDAIEVAVRSAAETVLTLGPVAPVPLTDLVALFEHLTAGGVPCAVVTSDDHASALALLDALGVSHLVAAVVGGDETERPKPHADPLLLAADRLATEPHRLLMVGDSSTDQGAARAAGCPFVAVGHGTAAAGDCDAVVAHVGEITIGGDRHPGAHR